MDTKELRARLKAAQEGKVYEVPTVTSSPVIQDGTPEVQAAAQRAIAATKARHEVEYREYGALGAYARQCARDGYEPSRSIISSNITRFGYGRWNPDDSGVDKAAVKDSHRTRVIQGHAWFENDTETIYAIQAVAQAKSKAEVDALYLRWCEGELPSYTIANLDLVGYLAWGQAPKPEPTPTSTDPLDAARTQVKKARAKK